MKRISKEIKSAWIATFSLFIVMNLGLIVWRIWQPTSLIVDQSVLIIFITALLYKFWAKYSQKKRVETLNFSSFISVLASLIFLVWVLCVPGTVERSRSLHLFQWITYDSASHSQEQVEAALNEAYESFDLQGFRLRLHEHQLRGLVSKDSRRLSLTATGQFVFWSAKQTAAIYNLKGWYNVPLQ